MDLADGTAHRALAYLTAVQRRGYVMTVAELEAYMAQPGRRPGTPGTPGKPERVVYTTGFERGMRKLAEDWGEMARTLSEGIARSVGAESRTLPAEPGTPGQPPESIAAWLARLRWARVSDQRIRTTPLGDAMLGHLEQASVEAAAPVGVVLDQGDELAVARVVQELADIGPSTLVDRYFSIEGLVQIIESTEVEAVLMGTGDRKKIAGLEAALGTLPFPRRFEVRQSDVFHDRFVIPRAGPVWLLGTSFSGLAKRLSVMVRIDDERMADALRHELEAAWEDAALVGTAEPSSDATDEDPGMDADTDSN